MQDVLSASPLKYLTPVWEAVLQSPSHVMVEVGLALAIVYILFFKKAYDPSKKGYGARAVAGLSEKEKEELIAEWEPEPLVAPGSGAAGAHLTSTARTLTIEKIVPGSNNTRVTLVGAPDKQLVTFCSADFLGLGASAAVRAASHDTLEKYTLGSCGPRGFYGTTRKHLELEERLAAFMGADESITYSDAVAAIASAIPAFAKRGDVLLVDAGVNHAVQTGARLSRSKVTLFKHNDMADLRAQLAAVAAADRSKRDSSLEQRRFIVVEGLYANYGDLCPLKEVVALAREFRWRVICDDSLGFAALGAHGRGSIEAAGLIAPAPASAAPAATAGAGALPRDPVRIDGVDVLLGSLATSLASVGGFCIGSREVVDHQRLSGAGYCFSASAPPFLCAAATAALQQLQEHPELPGRLRSRCEALHAALEKAGKGAFRVVSAPVSPVKHCLLDVGEFAGKPHAAAGAGAPALPELSAATLKAASSAREREERILAAVVAHMAASGGVLATFSHQLPGDALAPRPTLKLSVSLAHSDADIAALVKAVEAAARAVPGIVAATA